MTNEERQRMAYYYSILDLCRGNPLALTPEERQDYMALVKKQLAEQGIEISEDEQKP